MVNLAPEEPGLYFRLSDNSLTKIGPIYVGSVPPNDGAQGSTDYCVGEQWLDVSNPNSYVLKVWSGTQWVAITPEDAGVSAAGDEFEVQINDGNDNLAASPNLTFDGSKLTASNVEITDGNIAVKSDLSNAGSIDLYCESNNAHRTRLKSAAHSEYVGNVDFTLPAVAPTEDNYFLTSDADGVLSWGEVETDLENISATGLGNDTQVVFIDGTTLGAESTFTFDKSTSLLTTGGLTATGNIAGVNAAFSGTLETTLSSNLIGDITAGGKLSVADDASFAKDVAIVGNTTTAKITATNFDFSTQAAATPTTGAKFVFGNTSNNSKYVTFGNLKSEILKGEIVYYDSSTNGGSVPDVTDASFKEGTIWVDTNPAQIGDVYIFTGSSWEFIHNDYVLPAATGTTLGGVKVPTAINGTDTNLRLSASNELYAIVPNALVYILSGDLEALAEPGSPAQGHLYIHTGADGADLWGDASNGTVNTNDRVVYNAAGGWDVIPGGTGGAFTEETNGIIADNPSLNVGIGVATGVAPAAKLAVTETGTADILIHEASNSNTGLKLQADSNGNTTIQNTANGHVTFSTKADAGNTKELRFKTKNAQRMQLGANGDLKIGNTSTSQIILAHDAKIKYLHAGSSTMVELTDISTLPSIATA